MTKRIAIIQGGAFGDNINSTLMLQPLRQAFPDCSIEVHTSNIYGSAFANNPLIDDIVEHAVENKLDAITLATTLPDSIRDEYDLVLADHPFHRNDLWDHPLDPDRPKNLIHTWINTINNLGIAIDKPETVLYLTENEISRAQQHISQCDPLGRKALLEISCESGQSYWNDDWTVKTSHSLLNKGFTVLLSSKHETEAVRTLKAEYGGRVQWLGGLSIRECAEVYNFCRVFVSVSSGLSNACNTNWCSRNSPKWFEAVNSTDCDSRPLREDGKVFYYGNNSDEFASVVANGIR